MSVCDQQTDTGGGGASPVPGNEPVREMYETKSVSKVVRVLTVLAYLLSVSLAAILLSVYYVCVWKSPDLPLTNDTGDLGALRADYFTTDVNGGSNTSVSDEYLSSNYSSLADDAGDPSPPPATPLADAIGPPNATSDDVI